MMAFMLTTIEQLDLIGQIQSCNPAKRLLTQYHFKYLLEAGTRCAHTVLDQLRHAPPPPPVHPLGTLRRCLSFVCAGDSFACASSCLCVCQRLLWARARHDRIACVGYVRSCTDLATRKNACRAWSPCVDAARLAA
ncbi:hypothetical protein AB1Y20_001237 [Prymnesium parvum]|uniref:Uncharacterized protein n=1 Tax=Prymnesium parvum TaxID=97485 RepID=A0AB34K780_PRYPA|mmetsp:Transcript_4974/g.7650  ORF Transcript_4974/g.7650 Transcript_4974/m.7650 type:complete len:136 (+) Transcript_4974:466-873(+)